MLAPSVLRAVSKSSGGLRSSSVRSFTTSEPNPFIKRIFGSKGGSSNKDMIDETFVREQVKGIEKYRMLAQEAGNDNPFDTFVTKTPIEQGKSKKLPIFIASTKRSRLVGCSCESDYKDVVWFELEAGDARQCECGYWFQLIPHDPMDKTSKGQMGQGYGHGLSYNLY